MLRKRLFKNIHFGVNGHRVFFVFGGNYPCQTYYTTCLPIFYGNIHPFHNVVRTGYDIYYVYKRHCQMPVDVN